MNPRDVTAVVLARDEERNLARALQSLPEGMPILVIDHESQDATAYVARSHGGTVIARPFQGFVEARRFALTQVATPWTLMIDADEVIDDRLRAEIVRAADDLDGYELRRTTFYCARPMRMWRGERLLRLFRTHRARIVASPAAGGDAQLHERWVCDGKTGTLEGELLHYSYSTPQSYREKFDRYTSMEAGYIRATRSSYLVNVFAVPARFVWYMLGRGALLDGVDGARVAWASARYAAVVHGKALAGPR